MSAANTADVKAAPGVLVWVLKMSERIAKVLADKGYRGALSALIRNAFSANNRSVEVKISQRCEGTKGFQLEPKRWIVERTWTWLENARALSRDYETLPENHEGIIYVVMIRLMLRRLLANRRMRKPKTT